MLVALLAAIASAAPPVPYQGRMLDTAGTPIEGTPLVTFAIYDRAEDAEPTVDDPTPDNSPLWTETQNVPFNSGYFAVQLGIQVDLEGVFTGEERWVELQVAGTPMPRQPIYPVPMATFALHAETADRLSQWSQWDTSDHIAGAALCSGMLHGSYGQLRVVRSNGSSCASACDSQDTGGGPYQNFHCYGSVGADWVKEASADPGSNQSVFQGWFGADYCGSTNGMNRYCCCKSNYNSGAN